MISDDELLTLADEALRLYGNNWNYIQREHAALKPRAIKERIERHRAEVERLTRERDETLAAVRATMSRLMDERDAAESALAVAQKRLEKFEE